MDAAFRLAQFHGLPWFPKAGGRCGIVAAGLLSLTAAAQTGGLSALQSRLSNHIDAPRFEAAAWGVKIASLETERIIFERNPQKLLKPASNAKLYTGALALDRLGPDFRIKTSLLSHARPDRSGNLRGDLVVFGRGDPTFSARFHDGAHTNLLSPLADALVAAGVRRVQGDLIGDESFFRGPPMGSQWAWQDLQNYYGAETSSLTVEDNTVDLIFSPGAKQGMPCRILSLQEPGYLHFDNRARTTAAGGLRDIRLYRPIGENTVYVMGGLPVGATNFIDAIAVHQPARWFVSLLAAELARHGIRVAGKTRTMNWLDRDARPDSAVSLIELASVSSPPLAEMLPKMLKPSQNLYAQLLLLQVGAQRSGGAEGLTNAAVETEQLAIAALRAFIAETGIDPDTVLLEDGSGLSRGTLVTANATVALLTWMHHHPPGRVFKESLPIAGIDGTLRHRMKGTAAAGNARAKTGTLRYVNTLSGYVTTKAGEQLVFSFMLNNYDGPGARPALDAMVVMLAELDARTN
jgi:D-alanyl-D-alanine carboxypeptidase/D-alanyl-D-alanine-endopeptidase (penicillin-binding protein 4)